MIESQPLAARSLSEELARLKLEWEELARLNPLSAIDISCWNWNLEKFFARGIATVNDRIRPKLREFGQSLPGRSALDFGCGLGRNTAPLTELFENCVGIDLSNRMVELARTRHKNVAGLEFKVLESTTLPFAREQFDLVISLHVLQHQLSREAVIAWVGELIRVLAPGGLLILQLPHRLVRSKFQVQRRVYWVLRNLGVSGRLLLKLRLNPIRMLAVDEQEIRRVVQASGGDLVSEDIPKRHWRDDEDRLYYITRRPDPI